MPIEIDEVEVVAPPATTGTGTAPPPAAAPRLPAPDELWLLQRELSWRADRLRAD